MIQLREPQDLEPGDLILDLRTPPEYDAIRLKYPHVWIPLEKLDCQQFVKEHSLKKKDPIYLLCRSGKRAAIAVEKFAEIGYKNVFIIDGGILNVINQRLPVTS